MTRHSRGRRGRGDVDPCGSDDDSMSPITALVALDGTSLPTHAESRGLPALLADIGTQPLRCVASTPGHLAVAVSGGTYVHAFSAVPSDVVRAEDAMRRARADAARGPDPRGPHRTASSDLRAAFGSGEFGGVVDGTLGSSTYVDRHGASSGDGSQISFHGASPVVKIMFLPGDVSRTVPCVLVAVQENGAVSAWCRDPSAGSSHNHRWIEMAEPRVPGGPPEVSPPLRGYQVGSHGAVVDAALAVSAGVESNGGGRSCQWGGCVVRVAMIVRGHKRRVDDPRGIPRGRCHRCLVIRTIRMPSVESVAAAQRSPFSFVRETVPESADGRDDSTTNASEKEFPPSDDGETVAEYPNAVSLLGAGGIDMYVVCATSGGDDDDDGVGDVGRVEAYRWDTAERVCVARVDVAVAASVADAAAAEVRVRSQSGKRESEGDEDSGGSIAVALHGPSDELLAVTRGGEVIVASPPLSKCPLGTYSSGGSSSSRSSLREPIAWRQVATLAGFREEFGTGARRWSGVMSVAARGSFLHLAWCHDSKSTARVTDEDADHSFQMPPGTSAVTTYHLTTGAAVGTAPLPSLPPARDSVLRREDVGDDHARGRKGDEEARDGSGKTRGGVVTIEAGGGSAPDVLVCAVETGGSGGLYRLATRVPPALAASIATQLPCSGRVPDDSAELRRRHRTLRALADECGSWGGSADGARRVASLAIAELEASAAARGVALIDDDSGSNLGVKPGGSLRAALLLREKDSPIADSDSWRSAAVKCVEFAKASSSTFEGYSPADVRVIEGALRADDDDVQSIHRRAPNTNTNTPSSEAEEVSESKWKRLGTPGMARRVDPEEVEDMTWYALDDELPVYADLRVGAAVLASAEASAKSTESTANQKCKNALHLAAKAARKRDEPTAALSTGRMFDNHAAETVADLSDASFDGHTPVRDGDEFDVAFRKSIDFISAATVRAEDENSLGVDGVSDGIFESVCANLHTCWPRALPSFVRAHALGTRNEVTVLAARALRSSCGAPTKMELRDGMEGGISRVARACLLHLAGHSRAAAWMLLTKVRCVNDPEAALTEMLHRIQRNDMKAAANANAEAVAPRHSSEEDDSSESSSDDGDEGPPPMSARAAVAFGDRLLPGKVGSGATNPLLSGSPLSAEAAASTTPLGWRLATELLRSCAHSERVSSSAATADVFDVMRAAFTAHAGDASSRSRSRMKLDRENGFCAAEDAAGLFLSAANVLSLVWSGDASRAAEESFARNTTKDDIDHEDFSVDAASKVVEFEWEARVDALQRLAAAASKRLRALC